MPSVTCCSPDGVEGVEESAEGSSKGRRGGGPENTRRVAHCGFVHELAMNVLCCVAISSRYRKK